MIDTLTREQIETLHELARRGYKPDFREILALCDLALRSIDNAAALGGGSQPVDCEHVMQGTTVQGPRGHLAQIPADRDAAAPSPVEDVEALIAELYGSATFNPNGKICDKALDLARRLEEALKLQQSTRAALAETSTQQEEHWRERAEAAEAALREAQAKQCHHGWRGSVPDEGLHIQTPCPACGARSLFIGKGGHLTCARVPGDRSDGCPSPSVEQTIDELKTALQHKDALLREVLPKIGRVDFTPVACPNADKHILGSGQSGFTINDNQETGMIRCHTCGHRWQSVMPDPLIERIQKELDSHG